MRERTRRSGPPAAGWLVPALVGAVVAVFHGTVSLRLYSDYRSGMDLAIFDQAVRALSHFRTPVSSMKSPGMNLWGDHFHPVLVLAAPTYWVWDDPRVLLLVQAGCIGLTAALVVACARRRIPGGELVAALLGLAFALSPGVQYAAVFDFHEVALGMPVLALACWALLRRDVRWFTAMSLLLLLVKEDTGLLVIGLGGVAMLRGHRRSGAVVTAAGAAWTVLVLKVVLPALSPTGDWLYSSALPGLGGQLTNTWRAFVSPGELTATLVTLLLACALLPLGSNLVLALVPMLASRAITGNQPYFVIFNHYNLLPCVVLAFAAAEGLGRLVHRRWLVRVAAAALALAAVWNLLTGPSVNQLDDVMPASRRAAAQEAIAQVPAGESVAADAYLTPHLTKDHPVTQQVRPTRADGQLVFRDDIGRPLVARYRILDRYTHSNGDDPNFVPVALEQFGAEGCRQVFDREGFLVLDCGA